MQCYFGARRRRRRRRRPRRVKCRSTEEWTRLCWIGLTAETRRAGFQRLSIVLPARLLLSNCCFQRRLMSETPGVSPRSRSAHSSITCLQPTHLSSEENERETQWIISPAAVSTSYGRKLTVSWTSEWFSKTIPGWWKPGRSTGESVFTASSTPTQLYFNSRRNPSVQINLTSQRIWKIQD